MKNSNLFLLVAALFAFVSCGTANLTAQWGASQYRNGIYYSPAAQAYVQAAPAQTYSDYVQAEPEAVDVQNVVQPVSPVLANGESYEDLLRKFDSPVYVVNVDYVDLYPWWTMNFAWYWPSWRWHHSWYAGWYPGSYWDWYWADSWWYNRHWYSHNWYNHHWYAHHYYPHYRPIHHPPHHRPLQPARNVYYGKRDYVPSYRDVNRGAVSTGSKSPMGTPSGSVTRRPGDTRGNTAVVKGQQAQQGKQGQQSQPQYRRTTGKNGSGDVKSTQTENKKTTQSTQQNSRSQSEYRRSSSSSSQQYNRSSSYSPSRSSYGNSGGASRSSGSSSGSYRRR